MSSKGKIKQDRLAELISSIKKNRVKSTKNTAQNVAGILREIVDSDKMWKEPKDLLEWIQNIGNKLIEADPMAFYIGNIIKRIEHTIREESQIYH